MLHEAWATESPHGGQPPGEEPSRESSGIGRHGSSNSHVTRSSNLVINSIIQLHNASCTQQDDIGAADKKLTSLADGVQGHPLWAHRTFNVIGFGLSLSPSHPSQRNHPLHLSLWPEDVSKGSFIKYG